jgi:acetolactate synthase-1/2/3 large subunit
MDLEGPAPDFAPIARGLGWHAEGPIEDPAELGPALVRAIAEVKSGTPALVDAVVWRRGERT